MYIFDRQADFYESFCTFSSVVATEQDKHLPLAAVSTKKRVRMGLI